MLVTRRSMFSGEEKTLDVPVTAAALTRYEAGGALLQDAFPECPAPLREFLKTGNTPEEWAATFGSGPEATEAEDGGDGA